MYMPSWYDSAQCGKVRLPNLHLAAQTGKEYAEETGIKKNPQWQNDSESILLSVIDCQIDFVSPKGTLFVPGAVEDTDRLCKFIYANTDKISHILASLDSHYLFQPFHPLNWVAGSKPTTKQNGTVYIQGDNPEPFTVITLKELRDDVWRVLRFHKKMNTYLEKLEQDKRKQLRIWPLHCILGTLGHAWDPSFAEALTFHAAARHNQWDATAKGMSQLSEHYGILKAEVQFPEDPLTQLNTRVLSKWEEADRVYFAGQAKSHCCLATLEQVVDEFSAQGKNHLLHKIYVLEDCMSSIPDISLPDGTSIEFDRMTNERFEEMKKMGVKFIQSTELLLKNI